MIEEKSLKRWLKRKVCITQSFLVSFLITGSTVFAAEPTIPVDKKFTDSAIHYVSVNPTATGEGTNYDNDGAKGVDSIAIGQNSSATANSSVALGHYARVKAADGSTEYDTSGKYAVAIGNGSLSEGAESVSIGKGAEAKGSRGVSIGSGAGNSSQNNHWNTFVGAQNTGANSDGELNSFFGTNSGYKSVGNNNSYLGGYAGNNARGSDNTYVGFNTAWNIKNGAIFTEIKNERNTVLGAYSGTYMTGNNNLIGGYKAGFTLNGHANTIFGFEAGHNITGNFNTVNGYQAGNSTTGSGNIALGQWAGSGIKVENGVPVFDLTKKVVGNYNTAIGLNAGSNISGNNHIAFGTGAGTDIAAGSDSIAIGTQSGVGMVTGLRNVAIGYGSGSNASEKKQGVSGSDNTAVGSMSGQGVVGGHNSAFGVSAGLDVIGHRNTAIGSSAGFSLTGDNNVAMGRFAGSKVEGNSNIAIGEFAGRGFESNLKMSEAISIGKNAMATANKAIAVGSGAEASAENTISIGTGNKVSGANSGAIGDPSVVSGSGSYSLGNNNTITANNAFVFGSGVTNGVENSIVLGNGSTVENPVGTSSAVINNVTYSNFAGNTPISTVSIGTSGKERTITNVAAGRISATSTDAINGSQLFSVAEKLSTQTAEQIEASKTKVLAGENVTVIEGTEGNAKTYTVNASNASVVGGSSNVVVTSEKTNASGGKEFNVDLAKDLTGITSISGDKSKLTFGEKEISIEGSKLTNVAAGEISATSTDAVNGSQLHAIQNALQMDVNNKANVSLDNITDAGKKVITDLVDVQGSESIKVTSAVDDTSKKKTFTVALSQNLQNQINKEESVSEADEGMVSVKTNDTANDTGGKDFVVDLKDTVKATITSIGTGTVVEGDTNTVTGNAVFEALQTSTENAQIAYKAGDEESSKTVKTSKGFHFKGDDNIAISTEADGGVQYRLNKDLKGITSISNGETSLTFGDKDISFGGSKLTNVAAGEISATSTDAVNGSQLHATNQRVDILEKNSNNQMEIINKNAERIANVKNEVAHVGSLSAALAALHPMQYDPLQPNQVMAGIGSYRDKQAVAVGVTHYFNENLMMTAGVSIGNESRTKTMANVGLTWKIGKDEDRKELPERYKEGPLGSIYIMQKEMDSLLQENKGQKELLQKQQAQIDDLKEKLELLLKNR